MSKQAKCRGCKKAVGGVVLLADGEETRLGLLPVLRKQQVPVAEHQGAGGDAGS
jgi:hypothetical protein